MCVPFDAQISESLSDKFVDVCMAYEEELKIDAAQNFLLSKD
jgi:hypothetical protein